MIRDSWCFAFGDLLANDENALPLLCLVRYPFNESRIPCNSVSLPCPETGSVRKLSLKLFVFWKRWPSGFGHDLELDEKEIGGAALEKFGNPSARRDHSGLPCVASRAAGSSGQPGVRSAILASFGRRRDCCGFARNSGPSPICVPRSFIPSLAACSPLREEIVKGTDILIVRELLGGLYFGQPRSIEGAAGARQAVNTMRYSEPEIERIARVAFHLARTRRQRVAFVDKANVLECSRLWREVVTRIGRDFPDVQLSHHVCGLGRHVAGPEAG